VRITIFIALSIGLVSTFTGCGGSCSSIHKVQTTLSGMGCQYLGPNMKGKRRIYTWVCSHRNGDEYRDFVEKNGELCFIGSEVL